MSIWGKLAGAAAGLAIGGPHRRFARRCRRARMSSIAIRSEDGPAENQVAFTVGVIALGAKMAKADGVVTDGRGQRLQGSVQGAGGRDEERRPRLQSRQAGRRPATRPTPNSSRSCSRAIAEAARGRARRPVPHRQGRRACCIRARSSSCDQVAKRFGITDTEFAYIKARHVTAAKRNPYDDPGHQRLDQQ